MDEDSVNVNKLPAQVVDTVLAERRGEWDALVAKVFSALHKARELGKQMSDVLWDLCMLIGTIDTLFPYPGAMHDLRHEVNKLAGDPKYFPTMQVSALKKVYYCFLYERDTRFPELSYMHHQVAAKADGKEISPHQWLHRAREEGWTVHEMMREMGNLYFVDSIVGGKMGMHLRKYLSKFILNEATLGFMLNEQAKFVREKYLADRDDPQLASILNDLEKWGAEKQIALEGVLVKELPELVS